VFPFTSAKWPDLAKFNQNRAVPVAQISLSNAGLLLRQDIGEELLQVWLREFGEPVLQLIPVEDLEEQILEFTWGNRTLRSPAEAEWKFLWERPDSVVEWPAAPSIMYPQLAGDDLSETRLGGYPGLHPDLLDEDWFTQNGRRVLLQLGSEAGDRGLVVHYDRTGTRSFDIQCCPFFSGGLSNCRRSP